MAVLGIPLQAHLSSDGLEDGAFLHQEIGVPHQVTAFLHQEVDVLYQVIAFLHQDAGVLHQVTTVLYQDAGVLHQVTTVLHQVIAFLHQEVGVLHQVTTVLHQEVNALHPPIGLIGIVVSDHSIYAGKPLVYILMYSILLSVGFPDSNLHPVRAACQPATMPERQCSTFGVLRIRVVKIPTVAR